MPVGKTAPQYWEEGDDVRPEHPGGRHHGEEPDAALMAGQVGQHAAGKEGHSQEAQHPERQIGGDVDREQRHRERSQAQHLAADRDDAGRHRHREIGRGQFLQPIHGIRAAILVARPVTTVHPRLSDHLHNLNV